MSRAQASSTRVAATTAVVLWSTLAAAQERVALDHLNRPPAVFDCRWEQPPDERVCHRNWLGDWDCRWTPPPGFYTCSWTSNGLSDGDTIHFSTECCAAPGAVDFVLEVSDELPSWKGLRIGNLQLGQNGRGYSLPNTPPLRAGPLSRSVASLPGSTMVLSKQKPFWSYPDLYDIDLAELVPYAGRVAVFRWVRDFGPAPLRLPTQFATQTGAPHDGSLLQEPSGALWVVFGETRFPLPDTATMNRLYPNRFAYRVASGAPGGALRSVPADGTLLREESGRISVVFGSAKFAVPDMATFDRLFPGGSTFQVADGSLADIPDAPVDGTLLREENGRISAVVGRARFAIPDEPTLTRLFGGRPVFQLWDDAPSGIPEVPIDGTLLREESGAISVVLGGARLGVPDVGTFQRLFGARPTFPLWDGALDSIPTTPRDGTVLREESGALWVIVGQSRLPIPDPATYGRLYPTHPVLQVWDGALSGISDVPLDGTLLSDESGRVFVVIGGARFAVPGQVTRERLFPGQPLHPVWNGFLDRLPNVPADGTLLREDNGRTWVVYAQARFQVPDPRTLQRLFPGQTVHQVWDGALDAISRIPADGALLREESGRISVVYAGARFAVPDPRTFQRFFAGRPVFQVWDGALAQVPDVPGSGTLLREESGRIWVVHAGAKFAVPDWPTFQRLFAGRPVFQLWDGAPKQIPDIPADGTLLREENGAIWVVYGGARFHVPDPVTLQRLFPGVPIFQLWDGALDRLGNIPSDGTCLGEEDEPSEVYDIFGGCRQPAIPLILIDPWGRIQFKYPSCRRLWDQSLSHIPPCS